MVGQVVAAVLLEKGQQQGPVGFCETVLLNVIEGLRCQQSSKWRGQQAAHLVVLSSC